MTGTLLSNIPFLLFALLLLGAAVQDLTSLRISNPVSVAVLAAGIIGLALNFDSDWWQHLLAFLAVLVFGMVLFRIEWVGGGDAKLMAAAAFAFDFGGVLRFVAAMVLLGGLLALLFMAGRLFVRSEMGVKERRSLPYGVAIAAGAIFAAWAFPATTVFGEDAPARPVDILLEQGWPR